jgi:hypothetical protein
MRRKSIASLSLSLLILVVAITTAPSAEAYCENQWTSVTIFYAWVYTGDPSRYRCEEPIIASYFTWQEIGRIVESDCEGNSSWGDTTTCTGPGNVQFSTYQCGVACDN